MKSLPPSTSSFSSLGGKPPGARGAGGPGSTVSGRFWPVYPAGLSELSPRGGHRFGVRGRAHRPARAGGMREVRVGLGPSLPEASVFRDPFSAGVGTFLLTCAQPFATCCGFRMGFLIRISPAPGTPRWAVIE